MKNWLTGAALALGVTCAHPAPVVYTDEAAFLADLAGYGYTVVSEGFENGVIWAASRNSIVLPGSTQAVNSKGLRWTSNYAQNDIATGDVGGSAPEGTYAIYSLPHGNTADSGLYCDSAEDPNIPIECYQNDGLTVASATGRVLHAFGGRVDSNTGTPKITFLLDGVDINGNDTDNVGNWQREGDLVDNWSFIGVIDTDGFSTVEMRELEGKDFQQVLLFADDFTIGTAVPPVSCGVNTGLASYSGTETVDLSRLALTNATAEWVPVEWKVWLVAPVYGSVGIVNVGSDGTMNLEAGFASDFGPVDMFQASDVPVGSYLIGCRLLDPVTGELIDEEQFGFEITP